MSKCANADRFVTPAMRHAWTEIQRMEDDSEAESILVRHCWKCGEQQIGTAIPKRERDQFEMMEGRS